LLDVSPKLKIIVVSTIIAVSKYSVLEFLRFRTEKRKNMAGILISFMFNTQGKM
jgi:hypothetical protein